MSLMVLSIVMMFLDVDILLFSLFCRGMPLSVSSADLYVEAV